MCIRDSGILDQDFFFLTGIRVFILITQTDTGLHLIHILSTGTTASEPVSYTHLFEVDEFYGENEGLIVAEVELESEDEAFVKPDFIGEEVTGDIRYYNSQLMKKPYKTW